MSRPQGRPSDQLEASRCAVVGHPVAHSLSPAMHRRAYRELGLDWTYQTIEVAPGALASHVASLDRSWRALSVTAPHKRAALHLADSADSYATASGGANTLLFGSAIEAYNTDVPGAIGALRERGVERLKSVLVLGGGATAASLALAVASLGAERIEFRVRDIERAATTAGIATGAGLKVVCAPISTTAGVKLASVERTGAKGFDLVVSTLPADAVTQLDNEDLQALVAVADAVFDVGYQPWPSALASVAEEARLPVVSGLDLLAHQAADQVRLMAGREVAPALLREAALEQLQVAQPSADRIT